MTGSCPDGRDCRLPRMSRVFIALLALACALLICDVAEAAEYGADSGIDNITSSNCRIWSALLSDNDSTVTCNIDVTSGALHLINATIRMGDGYSISVRSGATMNVTDGSTITRHGSGYYYLNYKSGSRGSLSASVIEYSDELDIATTDNITITGCTVRNNRNYGIRLTPTSGHVNITDCIISNTVDHHGIFIEFSQDNILRNNRLNNNSRDYSLYVTGDYDQDIDTSNTVNGGLVYYKYNDSGTITGDANIGHVTIVNCNGMWFADCTIHNGDGVRIVGSSSSGISGSTIENNARQGVCFTDSSNNFINDSRIWNNNQQGILSEGSSGYNHVIDNSIINNSAGLNLIGEGHNNFADNNISDNRGNGIAIGGYTDHTSQYNILHNNTIRLNNASGITFHTNYNNLTSNTISDNRVFAFKFPGATAMCYYNHIWRSNTANGEEINYYYNENGITVPSKTLIAHNVSNVGKITLINCYNFDIHDNILSNNIHEPGSGIFLWNSYENDLTSNTISNNYDGIRLHNSSNNKFTDLQTTYPCDQHGAIFGPDSNYNSITDSSLAAMNQQGVQISSSNHTTLANIIIASMNQPGLTTASAYYIDITNATIVATASDGVCLSTSDNVIITESDITANSVGVDCANSDYTEITNTAIKGEDGICMSESHWGDLTNNVIDATLSGIFLTTSSNHNVTKNKIDNYAITGILLEEYSTNTTMIGNDLTRNGAEFDIRISDSNDCVIAPNNTVTADYTYYLTDDTRLATLDTVFNKTKVGYEDTSDLTLMWRIDVLCWDNYHKEAMWSNLTVQYSDFSDANGSLCWEGEISAKADANPGLQSGRLSGNPFNYWGPPTSEDNWLPIIEYKQNVSGKTTYQPMNCTAINGWDVLQKIYGRTYRNVTTTITEPGVTILVDAGYTPNSRCYYCHDDKLTFANTKHWTKYEIDVMTMTDPYTPGRCIDCHDETDALEIPHGTESGKDLLYQQSPQLCYSGRTGGLDCHSADAAQGLDQEHEFNQITHHPIGEGQLSCKACHDNHGTEYPTDLLKKYETTTTSGEYNSSYYALCLVCHLEEKIVATMSNEGDDHLKNYVNQTNFRDEYFSIATLGFNKGTPALQNIHSPQTGYGFRHPAYNCYSCHNPHGGNNPAMTRPSLNYAYITNLTPPGSEYEFGDWENQAILDHANWNNPTMNQAGGLDKPSNPDCSGCHDSMQLPQRFAYRTYVDYKPAGGAGCLECHDSSRSDSIRPILNLSAVKLAMHQNLSWWALEDVDANLPGTDKNFVGWLTARGYADTNIDRNNSICWACHSTNGTPPAPGFHPDRALNPYKCPKCHGPEDGQPPHVEGLVAAVDNHGPTTKGKESIFIQTDIGKNGSCGDCHAASRLPDSYIGDLKVWKWGSGESGYGKNNHERPFTGRTTMGDVSHYGLNKSQGQALKRADPSFDSPLFDTSNCLFCHCNSTNGAIWGNAPNVTGNMYGADTSNLSECYTYCHVLPDYQHNVTADNILHFHNKSLYAGGGFNCAVCHDIDSKYGVQSLVDADAIAAGIHGNVANNTITDSLDCDPRSKPCWGCHNSDGTQPDGMGDRNGIYMPQKKPWSCEDCHARSDEWNTETNYGETWTSSSYPPNRLPPRIYAHYPNSTTLKTNMSHGRCVDCHNNSINQSHADIYGQQLKNTLASSVSHYSILKYLIRPTGNCGVCHNNTTAGLIWGDAPQNRHGNFTNELNSGDGCFVCHTSNDH
ncbi:MAG: NosD domain-containing protein, partial [Euryarchaeota archaeon]|nr:NosD domain-containing protein [Euryarchaeota archaeon]